MSESGFKPTDQPHSPSAEHRRLTVAGRRVRLRTRESRDSDCREYAARRRPRASGNSVPMRAGCARPLALALRRAGPPGLEMPTALGENNRAVALRERAGLAPRKSTRPDLEFTLHPSRLRRAAETSGS